MAQDMGRGIIAPENNENIQNGAHEMRTIARTTAAALNSLDMQVNSRVGRVESKTIVHATDIAAWRQISDANREAVERLDQTMLPRSEAEQYGIEGPKGTEGQQGPRGLPGVNAIPADEAVADYLSATDSATHQAANAIWEANTDVLVESLNLDQYAKRTGTMTLWVHPDGSDGDGEGTEQSPYATINHAIRIAENLALDRSASVIIQLYAGTYTEQVRFTRSTGFNLNVVLRGPDVGGHPNTPLTVFDGEQTTTGCIYGANQGLTLTIEDLKFINYDTIAISAVRGNVFTKNVHYQDSAGGIRITNGAIDVKGGALENVGYRANGAVGFAGITSFMANRHSIGQQHGDLSQGPFFYGGYRGVLVQECATGHVDYGTFEDLEVAITSTRSSSVNPDGSSFKRNGIDLNAVNASSIIVGDRVTFGSGADSSSQQMYADATSTISTSMHWSGLASGNAIAERLQSESTETRTLVADNNTLFNYTITPYFFNDLRSSMVSPAKALIGRVIGEITDPAGTKRILFTIGNATVFTNIRANFTGPFTIEVEVIFRDRQNQILRMTLTANGEPVQVRTMQATVNVATSLNATLTLRRLNSQGAAMVHSVQTWIRGI